MSAVLKNAPSACDHEMTCPPCEHNHWSDLRTRKNVKMLLCHVCLAKWRLCACRCAHASCSSWAKRGTCSMGSSCPKLHVGHARPRAQRGSPPAVKTSFTDAPYDLDAVSVIPFYSGSGGHEEPLIPMPGHYGNLYGAAQAPSTLTPSSGPFTVRSGLPSPCQTPSSSARSLRMADAWAPPACISACGEYFEELDDYEPEGVAMTEEQLDALLRRCSLA